jgi:hypothetical protein
MTPLSFHSLIIELETRPGAMGCSPMGCSPHLESWSGIVLAINHPMGGLSLVHAPVPVRRALPEGVGEQREADFTAETGTAGRAQDSFHRFQLPYWSQRQSSFPELRPNGVSPRSELGCFLAPTFECKTQAFAGTIVRFAWSIVLAP